MAAASSLVWEKKHISIRNIVLVTWQRPPLEFVKLDVDGSSLGNPGRIGTGGLIRNTGGTFIVGFTMFAGNLLPELLGVLHGLKLAWNKGFRKVFRNSDSKEFDDQRQWLLEL
jgi:ribonuclease HI